MPVWYDHRPGSHGVHALALTDRESGFALPTAHRKHEVLA
eukprot:SAG11_NODE_23049_length_396_cov_0.595960_1_plen_39_part_10